jgi:hypothetical protein
LSLWTWLIIAVFAGPVKGFPGLFFLLKTDFCFSLTIFTHFMAFTLLMSSEKNDAQKACTLL